MRGGGGGRGGGEGRERGGGGGGEREWKKINFKHTTHHVCSETSHAVLVD